MADERVPYSEDEAQEAWRWVNAHGPANAWTATAGTAARMIGRLLQERERLMAVVAENVERRGVPYWQQPHD